MSEEISLSVKETNKLRAQIGLPLLPEEKSENDAEKVEVRSKLELSVEETNKLRASLGLKPIVIKEPESVIERKSESENRPGKAEEKPEYTVDTSSELFYKDAGSDWLERVGKGKTDRKKKVEVDKADSESGALSVAHGARELAQVEDGDIFTLEDKDVLDDDEGRIVNEKLSKAEKLRKEELEKKKLLTVKFGARYDEVDEEDTPERAQMAGSTIIIGESKKTEEVPEKAGTTKLGSLFDDIDEQKPTKTSKFKKRSLKKSKGSASKRVLDDDEVFTPLQPMVTESLKLDEEDENEDEEIQRLLAKNREKQQKKRKLLTPEELAREIQLHERVDLKEEVGGFVFNDTSEFLNSIGENIETKTTELEKANAASEEEKANNTEEVSQGVEVNEVKDPSESTGAEPEQETKSGPLFRSMADTLQYLRANRAVSVELEEEKAARKLQEQRVKEAELQRIAISIEERSLKSELEKDASYTKLSKEEQDSVYDRLLNERLVAKGIVEKAKKRYEKLTQNGVSSYNPKVQLQYKDKSGNELNAKEAFKELSHKYHGTAPKHKKKKVGSRSEAEHVVG